MSQALSHRLGETDRDLKVTVKGLRNICVSSMFAQVDTDFHRRKIMSYVKSEDPSNLFVHSSLQTFCQFCRRSVVSMVELHSFQFFLGNTYKLSR